jgi:hypothetical protein
LRNGFEREGLRGCEYVPVVVKRPKGTTVRGFSIVNVLSRRAALHREQSVFDVFPPDYMFADQRGAIRSLRRTVLRREAIADTDFLRLDEYPFALYVSEAVTRVFQRLGCTGWSFVEVSTR